MLLFRFCGESISFISFSFKSISLNFSLRFVYAFELNKHQKAPGKNNRRILLFFPVILRKKKEKDLYNKFFPSFPRVISSLRFCIFLNNYKKEKIFRRIKITCGTSIRIRINPIWYFTRFFFILILFLHSFISAEIRKINAGKKENEERHRGLRISLDVRISSSKSIIHPFLLMRNKNKMQKVFKAMSLKMKFWEWGKDMIHSQEICIA